MNVFSDILRALQQQCEDIGIAAELSLSYAWQLLEAATKKTKSQLLTEKTITLRPEHQQWLQQALDRLRNGEPLQYIVGEVQFLDITLKIRPPLLIPRSETEEWVAKLIEYAHAHQIQPARILDIGTGSGCIALALAKAFPQAQVVGVDNNLAAILIARENADLNGIKNVQFMQSDVYDGLIPNNPVTLSARRSPWAETGVSNGFDLIVSNPPYVRETDWRSLDNSVRGWEDKDAIVAPDGGLAIIKRIISESVKWLRMHDNSMLWIEIDIHQGPSVQQLFLDAGFFDVTILQDVHGRDRVVWGTYADH